MCGTVGATSNTLICWPRMWTPLLILGPISPGSPCQGSGLSIHDRSLEVLQNCPVRISGLPKTFFALRKSEIVRGLFRRPMKITFDEFGERYMETREGEQAVACE